LCDTLAPDFEMLRWVFFPIFFRFLNCIPMAASLLDVGFDALRVGE